MARTRILTAAGLAALVAFLPSPPVHAEPQPVRLCKSYVQGRIDVLDAELHKGRKPNEAARLIKRRDKLRSQLADCTRNPQAYKKNI